MTATETIHRGHRITPIDGGMFEVYAPGQAESVGNTFTEDGARHLIDRRSAPSDKPT